MQPLLRVASPAVSWLRLALPGIAVAAILTLLAKALANELASGIGGLPRLPISPVMCAVVIGMLWRNTLGVPSMATEGLQWVMRGLLRTGIALVGLRLTLSGASAIAASALPVAVSCLCVGLLGATFIGRLFGVPPRLALSEADIQVWLDKRKPGQSRDDLVASNLPIIRDVANNVKKHCPDAFVIVISNPLDAMVYEYKRVTGCSKEKVAGMAGVSPAPVIAQVMKVFGAIAIR